MKCNMCDKYFKEQEFKAKGGCPSCGWWYGQGALKFEPAEEPIAPTEGAVCRAGRFVSAMKGIQAIPKGQPGSYHWSARELIPPVSNQAEPQDLSEFAELALKHPRYEKPQVATMGQHYEYLRNRSNRPEAAVVKAVVMPLLQYLRYEFRYYPSAEDKVVELIREYGETKNPNE